MIPNKKLTEMWTRAAEQYWVELHGSPAEEYLGNRGLLDAADQFMLGYVAEPAPGHEERFTGMLSIPYITPLGGVIGFKFRMIDPKGRGPKYNAPSGQSQHLYNVSALADAIDTILVVEGELDSVAATAAGYPSVAVPGSKAWKPHFRRCFDGIEKVVCVMDNDAGREDGSNPGAELADKVMSELPDAVRVSLPPGHDVNSTLQEHGAEYFAELIGAVK